MFKQELLDYVNSLNLEPAFRQVVLEIMEESDDGPELKEKLATIFELQGEFYLETAKILRSGR